jgi:SAM-dependent methyltransferase
VTGEIVEAGHLGGYRAGGDEATFYPALWAWLVHDLGVRNVIDVGCGDGVAGRYFQGLGQHCSVLGIDGVPQDDQWILEHDYASGPLDWKRTIPFAGGGDADLVWSCEFVEHVEERYVPNFLETFAHGRLVLMTHATPGQDGYHHVNCRESEYWMGALAAIGYHFDDGLTRQARAIAALNPNPWNHFKRSGLAFRRT